MSKAGHRFRQIGNAGGLMPRKMSQVMNPNPLASNGFAGRGERRSHNTI